MTSWLIMGTAERTEVTQNFENRQFEFFPKEKVPACREAGREQGFGK